MIRVTEQAVEAALNAWWHNHPNPDCRAVMSERLREAARTRLTHALTAALPHLDINAVQAEVMEADEERLARAAYQVDSTHHFGFGDDGLTCLCGFIGNARKRAQTEHITQEVLNAFDHD